MRRPDAVTTDRSLCDERRSSGSKRPVTCLCDRRHRATLCRMFTARSATADMPRCPENWRNPLAGVVTRIITLRFSGVRPWNSEFSESCHQHPDAGGVSLLITRPLCCRDDLCVCLLSVFGKVVPVVYPWIGDAIASLQGGSRESIQVDQKEVDREHGDVHEVWPHMDGIRK